jgi:hypothetical protein
MYYGILEIRGLSNRKNLKLFYGDSIVLDTAMSETKATFQISEFMHATIKNIKVLSDADTLVLSSADSMGVGDVLLGRNFPFPINFSVGFDSLNTTYSIIGDDSVAKRIKCSDGERLQYDTVRTNRKSGVFSMDVFADVYANQYSIFADVIDSGGVLKRAGEYSADFSINEGPKTKLRRSQLHFEAYLPYLPAVIRMPLPGGYGNFKLWIKHED